MGPKTTFFIKSGLKNPCWLQIALQSVFSEEIFSVLVKKTILRFHENLIKVLPCSHETNDTFRLMS